jgi:RNA polymerase sigma factor (TIGR02999 family)
MPLQTAIDVIENNAFARRRRLPGERLKGLAFLNNQAENEAETLTRNVFFVATMTDTRANNVTAILRAAQQGDGTAAARLLPLVYGELRKLAKARMARLPPGQTLQPTALVHEAYLRLLGKADLHLESRRHFFFAAARAMRDILLEQARSKAGPKRGGGRRRVELQDAAATNGPATDDVLALNEALAELEKEDPLKAQIVNLRYFAGMSMEETAQVLGLSERTLYRHWRFIKAWLQSRLDAPLDPE